MQIEPLFPVPIYVCKANNLQGIQDECFDALLKFGEEGFSRMPNNDPITHSLTDPTFTSNLIADFNLVNLEKEITEQVNNFLIGIGHRNIPKFKIVSSWMTHTAPGEYTPNHDHASADFSGVYYIITNGRDGDIHFCNPNPAMNHTYGFAPLASKYMHTPEVGKMIIFPGWLEHGVNSNQSDDVRVSISFNIIFNR